MKLLYHVLAFSKHYCGIRLQPQKAQNALQDNHGQFMCINPSSSKNKKTHLANQPSFHKRQMCIKNPLRKPNNGGVNQEGPTVDQRGADDATPTAVLCTLIFHSICCLFV